MRPVAQRTPASQRARTSGDIVDRWGSVIAILNQRAGLSRYAGPHGWNDPDMLQVGNDLRSISAWVPPHRPKMFVVSPR